MPPQQNQPTPAPTAPPRLPIEQPQVKPDKEPKIKDRKSSAVSTILLFLLAPIIAVSVTTFMFQSYEVDGESMETTLQHRDRLIVDKIPRTWARITKNPYIPHRGEIIIFNQSGLLGIGQGGERQLIKRVIGLPGERVVVKDGSLTVYNQEKPEGFNPDKSGLYTITSRTTPNDVDFTLKDNQIFVVGDNRANSADSREFGPITADQIVGKLSLRILPLDNAERF